MENINNPKKLFIKDMISRRCILAVEDVFRASDISFEKVLLGEVLIKQKLQELEVAQVQQELRKAGYDLVDSRANKIAERIKTLVREYLAQGPENRTTNLSTYIINRMTYDYSYLSDLFSSVEKTTIKKYLIKQRIEKVKELISHSGLSLTKIAFETGYSSVHHLSAQFRKITGLTPTQFRTNHP